MSLHDLNRVLIWRNRHKTDKAARLSSRLKPAGFGLLLLISILLAAGILLAAAAYVNITAGLPSVEEVNAFFDPNNGLILQPSRLYDRTGQIELLTLDNPGALRAYVWLDPQQEVHFSPLLARAVITLNQPDFWQSSGADWAHWSDPTPRTLAENLVSRLLLWQEENSPVRGLRMRLLAWQLTSRYGRDRVLEWYLNSASFGPQITGAESAARVYFGKSSADLNEAEVALLAGLSTAPALNPHDSLQASEDLLRKTLDDLVTAGLYTPEARQAALENQLIIQPPQEQANSSSPAFTRLAMQQLSALVSDDRVALGGLQIRSTLDMVQQEQLDCTLRAQLQRLESPAATGDLTCAAARLLPALPPVEAPLPDTLQAAGILMDPARGEILALTGKTSLTKTGDIYEGMQGGTALSPFLAAAVFSRGYSPASLVWDLPRLSVDDTIPLTKEIAARYRGPIRLRTALISDRLNPLEDLLETLGARDTWRLARPLGINNLENSTDPGRLLESGGSVSLLEIAQGMTVFASLGDLHGLPVRSGEALQPSTLLAVEDSYGQSLFSKDPIRRQTVLSAPLAYLVHNVLADESLRRAELGYPNPFELGRPAGAKYGNAENGREIWAAGYTPQREAVIWMGISEETTGTVLFPSSLGIKAAGGVWNAVMRQSLADQPATDWAVPDGVSTLVVCDPSGMLPTKTCPLQVSEVFLQGSEPTTLDDLYRTVQINRETGNIATVFTPPGLVEDAVFLSVPENARVWARAAGKATAPTTYDTIQTGTGSANAKIDQPSLFSLVNGKVSIRGSAGGDGFQNYRLQVGEGLNPQEWVEIARGSEAVESGLLGEWDTGGRNGLYAIRLLVVNAENRVETALSQVTVDDVPPLVKILSPQDGISVSGMKPVFLQVEISDSSPITKVDWQVDGKSIGETTQAPYINEWQKPSRGIHKLTVTVSDAAGNQTVSNPLTFVVE
ncbi:MAG: hypothetical protein GYA15_02010 [Leptolinea sp.]|jgi:membrane peptidoglycan carboxypeptidase|nr:hypothetical protein [Leptolinea sp.]